MKNISKYNLKIKHIIFDLKKYFKSEEFIFDLTVFSFISIFEYLVPHSRDKMLNLLQHSPKNEFIVSISIQIMISFNIGRYGKKISNKNNLKGWFNIFGFIFSFFLFIFPANFIEHSEESSLYLVLGLILGIFAMLFGFIYGGNYENNFINSKTKNRKKIKNLYRIFLIAFSYSALMLYQALEMEAMTTFGMDTENIVSVLTVTIIIGLLPYRILLLLEPPVSFFGVFMGITILIINLFS